MERTHRTCRVLVVEDEFLIRWSIGETLRKAGHTVVEAANGSAALSVLKGEARSPDVVMLDYRLPDSNDLTLLADIRRLSPGSAVVMMTAFGTPEVVARALALGVVRVMDKPFDMGTLDSIVRDVAMSRPD